MSRGESWTKEDAEQSALKCLQGLKKNNCNGYYFSNRNEALEHLDFAIAEFRDMKMQPALERALRHKDILKA